MIDAFGVVRTDISKGVPIKGQLALFPLKGMTRAKRISSFGYGHSGSYNPVLNRQAKQIPGQTYLSSQKANGKEFKIVSPKPPKTNDDIALSPEGQKFLEFRLKRLDREYAGRFASSGPKVSRNDPTDALLNSRKAESVSRLSGRQRVGKSFVPRSQLATRAGRELELMDSYRPSRIPNVTAIKATVLKEKQPKLFERRLKDLQHSKEAREFRASGEPLPRHPVTNMRSMRYIPKKSVYDPRSSGMNAETYKYLLKYKPSQAVRPPRKRIPFKQEKLF